MTNRNLRRGHPRHLIVALAAGLALSAGPWRTAASAAAGNPATGAERTEAEGKTDRAKGKVKNAASDVKGSAKGVRDSLKDDDASR